MSGRTTHRHTSLAALPRAGHQPGHTLLWILFFNQHMLQISQRGCWSLWHEQHTQADLTSVQWG